MQSLVINFLNKGFGYFGVTFLIALENIFPPIPSEVVLTFSGFMTTYSKMTVIGVILFSTLGSLIGAVILYYIGYILKYKRLVKFANSKVGRAFHLKESDISNANDWFIKKGNKTVFFCRFVPVIRSLISIPAGLSKMQMKSFLLFTFLGSLIWNSVLVILGRILGSKWNVVVSIVSKYTLICCIVLAIVIIVSTILFIKKRRKTQ